MAEKKEEIGTQSLTCEWRSQGADRTRARVVAEFAETRLGRDKLTGPRWNAVLKQMEGSNDEVANSLGMQVVIGQATRDLTLAYTAIARATNARLSAEAADDVTAEAP